MGEAVVIVADDSGLYLRVRAKFFEVLFKGL